MESLANEKRVIMPQFILITLFLLNGGFNVQWKCLICFFVMACVVWHLVCCKRTIKCYSFINYAFLCVIVCAWISVGFAFNTEWAVSGAMQYTGVYVFFLLCVQAADKDKETFAYCMKDTIYSLGLVSAAVGIILSAIDISAELVLTEGRLAPFVTYPNTFAMIMLVCIVLSYDCVGQKHKRIICNVVLWMAMCLSFSRINYVLAIVVCVGLIIFNGKCVREILIEPVLGVFFAEGFSKLFLQHEVCSRAATINSQTTEWLERVFYYKDSLAMIADHPFGVGNGNSYFLQGCYQSAVYFDVPYLHNGILQIAIDFGILAAIAMLLIIGCYFFKLKAFNNEKLAFLIIVLHGIVDIDWKFTYVLMLLAVFLSMADLKVVEIKLTKWMKIGQILACAILIVSCIWSLVFYSALLMQKNNFALKLFPNSSVALAQEEQWEAAADACNYMDEEIVYGLYKHYLSEGEQEKALEAITQLMHLRPIQIRFVELRTELLMGLACEAMQNKQNMLAIKYLDEIKAIPNYIEAQTKRIDDDAYKLKHKPDMEITITLERIFQEAAELEGKIK